MVRVAATAATGQGTTNERSRMIGRACGMRGAAGERLDPKEKKRLERLRGLGVIHAQFTAQGPVGAAVKE